MLEMGIYDIILLTIKFITGMSFVCIITLILLVLLCKIASFIIKHFGRI